MLNPYAPAAAKVASTVLIVWGCIGCVDCVNCVGATGLKGAVGYISPIPSSGFLWKEYTEDTELPDDGPEKVAILRNRIVMLEIDYSEMMDKCGSTLRFVENEMGGIIPDRVCVLLRRAINAISGTEIVLHSITSGIREMLPNPEAKVKE